jgi:hypothetical protein
VIIKEFLVSLGAKVDLTAMEKGLRSADRMAAQFGRSWIAQFAAAGAAVTALSLTASAGVVKLAGGLERVAPEVKTLQTTLKDSTEWIRKYLQENLAVPLKWIRKSLKDGHEGFQKNKEKILKGIGDLMLGVVRFAATVIRGATDVGRVIGRVLKAIPPEIALIGGALAALGLILKTGPLGIAMAIFTALILLLDDFYTYMDGGKSLFGDKWEAVVKWGEKFEVFLRGAKEKFDELRKKVSEWWEDLKGDPATLELWDKLKGIFESAGEAIGNVRGMWKEFIELAQEQGSIDKAKTSLAALSDGFSDLANGVLAATQAILDFFNLDLDNNGLSDLVDFALPGLKAGFEGIMLVFEGIGNALGLIGNALQVIFSFLRGDLGGVNSFGDKMLRNFVDFILPESVRPEGVSDVLVNAGLADPPAVALTDTTARKTSSRQSKTRPTSQASVMGMAAKPATASANAQRATSPASAQGSIGTTKAFAEGGVVQRPTYALIGEEGPEVVINPKKPNALTLVLQALQMPGLKAAVESPGLKAALSSPGLRNALDIGRRNLEMVNNAPAYMYQQIAYQNMSQNLYNTSQQYHGAQHNQSSTQTVANDQIDARSEEKNISLTIHNNTTVYGSGNAKEAADAVNKNNNTTLVRNLRGVLA